MIETLQNLVEKKYIPLVLLLLVLILAAIVRFEDIANQGMNKGDSFDYLSEAKTWADGSPEFMSEPDYPEGKFYRPVSFALQGLAVSIWGYNDYSIKILHASFDLINIIMIFILAVIVTRGYWIGFISSLLYAFNPKIIYLARMEMVHVESTFFLLLTTIIFILAWNNEISNLRRYILLYISGVIGYLTFNTHADLAFVIIMFPCFVAFKVHQEKTGHKLQDYFKYMGVFSFGFFSPLFLGMVIFGFERVYSIMYSEFTFHTSSTVQEQWNNSDSKLILPFKIVGFTLYYFFRNTFFVIGVLFVGNIIFFLRKVLKRDFTDILVLFIIAQIFIYIILYTIFFNSFNSAYCRLLQPLIPLIIISTAYVFYSSVKYLSMKFRIHNWYKHIFISAFILFFIITVKTLPGSTDFSTPYKYIYNKIGTEVNYNNKLLIAPLSVYYRDRGFSFDLYFGNNAIYEVLINPDTISTDVSLTEILDSYPIKYIFLSRYLDKRNFTPDYPFNSITIPKWEKYFDYKYELDKDLHMLFEFFKSKNTLMVDSSKHGYLYKISQNPLIEKNGETKELKIPRLEQADKYYREEDSKLVSWLKSFIIDY